MAGTAPAYLLKAQSHFGACKLESRQSFECALDSWSRAFSNGLLAGHWEAFRPSLLNACKTAVFIGVGHWLQCRPRFFQTG